MAGASFALLGLAPGVQRPYVGAMPFGVRQPRNEQARTLWVALLALAARVASPRRQPHRLSTAKLPDRAATHEKQNSVMFPKTCFIPRACKPTSSNPPLNPNADDDMDGVANQGNPNEHTKTDVCPDERGNANDGCYYGPLPTDEEDGDGTPDLQDFCQGVFGTEPNGCPPPMASLGVRPPAAGHDLFLRASGLCTAVPPDFSDFTRY